MEGNSILIAKQKELQDALHKAYEAQHKADRLRDELKILYDRSVPDDIKPGVCLYTDNVISGCTSNLRVDFIEIYTDDCPSLSYIRVHGYGVTRDVNEPDKIVISNDTVGIIRNGNVGSRYIIISREDYDSVMSEAETSVRKPISDWSKYSYD